MKRVLSLMLVFVMAVSLAACAPNPSEQGAEKATTKAAEATTAAGESSEPAADGEKVSLTVQAEPEWVPYYAQAVERVTANYPNAEITIKEVPSFDHLDTLDATDVMNEDVADVFAFPADRLAGLSQKEALATINAEAIASKLGGFDDYAAGFGGNLAVDGQYLGFPMNIETLILFVNKANAEAKGIDLTKPNEFTELDGEAMLLPAFNAWFGVALTNSADIEFLEKTADGFASDLTVDWADLPAEKQAAFTALYDYWKKHDELGTTLWDKDAAWGYMDSAFATGGNNVFRLEGPWSTGSLSEVVGENADDLMVLPIGNVTVAGKALKHWQGGWALGINARDEEDAEKMAIAEALVAELVNPEFAVDLFKATGKILVNVDASVYQDSDLNDVDKKVIAAVLESYANAPARPLFAEWGSVWDTWETAILSWTSVKPASAEEAYKQVQASFQAMMANFN